MSTRLIRAALPATLAVCGLLCVSAPAQAALGGKPMTPPSGSTSTTLSPSARAAAQGVMASITTAANYTVKQTTLDSGTVVREYIAQDGNVFGIAWMGPRVDLPNLLGDYFPQYASGAAALRKARGARGPVDYEQPGLVVRSGGHMGAFVGQAWLPQALPPGVSGDDIR
ncbi:DUF2844 domain-containing protein [Trinickia fusca]|uniref:DUF2844 domain-containing protein n=1 Tax=Trinickia fusca TaxID=2419777 RepID=A0A494XBW3_9BURK|nr:DUF2844 domain-containing protein [Trinickia fusca]RKP45634.1 DUF2844 domain-containing protein [Trinickia fusca]